MTSKTFVAGLLIGVYMGALVFLVWCIGEAIARWPWLLVGLLVGLVGGGFAIISAMGASNFSAEIRAGHIYGEE